MNYASLFAEIGTALSAYGAGGAQGLLAYQERGGRLLQQQMDQDFKRETQERDIAARTREAEIQRAFTREMEMVRLASEQEAARTQRESSERLAFAGIASQERIAQGREAGETARQERGLKAAAEQAELASLRDLEKLRETVRLETERALTLAKQGNTAELERMAVEQGYKLEQLEAMTAADLTKLRYETQAQKQLIRAKAIEDRLTQKEGAQLVERRAGDQAFNTIINRADDEPEFGSALDEAAARSGMSREEFVDARIADQGGAATLTAVDSIYEEFRNDRGTLNEIYGPNYSVAPGLDTRTSALQARRRGATFSSEIANIQADIANVDARVKGLADLGQTSSAKEVELSAESIAGAVTQIEAEIAQLATEGGYPDMLLPGSNGSTQVDLLRKQLADYKNRTSQALSNSRALLAARIDFTNLGESVIGRPTMGGKPGEEAQHQMSVKEALDTTQGKELSELMLQLQSVTPDQMEFIDDPKVRELIESALNYEPDLPLGYSTTPDMGSAWSLPQLLDTYRNGLLSNRPDEFMRGDKAKSMIESVAASKDTLRQAIGVAQQNRAAIEAFDQNYNSVQQDALFPDLTFDNKRKLELTQAYGTDYQGQKKMDKPAWARYIADGGSEEILRSIPDYAGFDLDDELDTYADNIAQFFGYDRGVVTALNNTKSRILADSGTFVYRNNGAAALSPVDMSSPSAMRGLIGTSEAPATVNSTVPKYSEMRSNMAKSVASALFNGGDAVPYVLAAPTEMGPEVMQQMTGVSQGFWGVNTSSNVAVPLTSMTTVMGGPVFTPEEALRSTKDGSFTLYDVALSFESAGLAVQGDRLREFGGNLNYQAKSLPIVPYGLGTDEALRAIGADPQTLRSPTTTQIGTGGPGTAPRYSTEPGMAGVYGGPEGPEQYRYGPTTPGRVATTVGRSFRSLRDPGALEAVTRATLLDRYLRVDVQKALSDGSIGEAQAQFLKGIQDQVRGMKSDQLIEFVRGGAAFTMADMLSKQTMQPQVYDPINNSLWSTYVASANPDGAQRAINTDINTLRNMQPGTSISINERGEVSTHITDRALLDQQLKRLEGAQVEVENWSKTAAIAGDTAQAVYGNLARTISLGWKPGTTELGDITAPVDYVQALAMRAGQYESQTATEQVLPPEMRPDPGRYRQDMNDLAKAVNSEDVDQTLAMLNALAKNASKEDLILRRRDADPAMFDRTFDAAWDTMSQEFKDIYKVVRTSNDVLKQSNRGPEFLHKQLRVEVPLEVFQKANPVEQTIYLWSALVAKRSAVRGQ